MFPGLLYSEAIESKWTVPKVGQDALWYPQTDMNDDSALQVLDLVSWDLYFESSAFVLTNSILVSSRLSSNI